MEPLSAATAMGLTDVIKRSFSNVFGGVNAATDEWIKKTKLRTVGRENFCRFIIRSVGTMPLFATTRIIAVDAIYVQVSISQDVEREKYRGLEDIERELRSDGEKAKALRSSKRKTAFTEEEGRKRFQALEQRISKLGRISRRDADRERGIDALKAIEDSNAGFALLGNAGSGKTTLFRYLALQLAKGMKLRGRSRFPVFIAVRDIARRGIVISHFIKEYFQNLEIDINENILHSLLRSGHLAILVDGLDETEASHQADILRDLEDMLSRFSDTLVCVSSRPFSLAVGLDQFAKWETLPLGFESKMLFIVNWFREVAPKRGERLVAKCKNNPQLVDLGSSPLLLSIICALYNNDLQIPSQLHELFSRSVEGLLGRWDAFRNIARNSIIANLSIGQRVSLVGALGAELFSINKVVFTGEDVTSSGCLRRAFEVAQAHPLPAPETMESLYNDFGILVERAPKAYSFSHLSLHEYLAARYIVDHQREQELLERHYVDYNWFEVIKQVASMLREATDYMDLLTNLISPGNEMHTRLLRETWEMRPACSGSAKKQLVRKLAQKLSGELKRIDATYTVFESKLIVNLSSSAWHLGDSLPEILKTISDSGMTYGELGCADPLFETLARLGNPKIIDIDLVGAGPLPYM